jgi:hypothetical protein
MAMYHRVGFTAAQSAELWERGKKGEVDRSRLWQAVLLHFCAFEAERRDHAAGPVPIASGADDGGTRGNISRHLWRANRSGQ